MLARVGCYRTSARWRYGEATIRERFRAKEPKRGVQARPDMLCVRSPHPSSAHRDRLMRRRPRRRYLPVAFEPSLGLTDQHA